MFARASLILGGLLGLLLTVPFSLSYFLVYGTPDEEPREWMTGWVEPLTEAGLLDGSAATYDRYGLGYLMAWTLALSGLAALLRAQRSHLPAALARAWARVQLALAVVVVGILGDYAPAGDVVGAVGFMLTMIGLLATCVCLALAGRAMRRHGTRGASSLAVAHLVPCGVVAGLAVVGHIPSGPGVAFMISAVIMGVTGPSLAGADPGRPRR